MRPPCRSSRTSRLDGILPPLPSRRTANTLYVVNTKGKGRRAQRRQGTRSQNAHLYWLARVGQRERDSADTPAAAELIRRRSSPPTPRRSPTARPAAPQALLPRHPRKPHLRRSAGRCGRRQRRPPLWPAMGWMDGPEEEIRDPSQGHAQPARAGGPVRHERQLLCRLRCVGRRPSLGHGHQPHAVLQYRVDFGLWWTAARFPGAAQPGRRALFGGADAPMPEDEPQFGSLWEHIAASGKGVLQLWRGSGD